MFASSRNTVREAMRILKAYGVVDVRPKVGAVIIDRRMDAVFDLYSFNTLELSQKTFLDTQSFRQLIEVGSMETLFERATADDVAELRDINEQMFAAETIEKAARQDFRFHSRLVAITGNLQIMNIYRMMQPVILRIMESGVNIRKFGETNHREHGAIIDALEARERLTYRYLVTMHLEAGLALFKEED
jgi:DNA-binding FadR family transcriptional regulator